MIPRQLSTQNDVPDKVKQNHRLVVKEACEREGAWLHKRGCEMRSNVREELGMETGVFYMLKQNPVKTVGKLKSLETAPRPPVMP